MPVVLALVEQHLPLGPLSTLSWFGWSSRCLLGSKPQVDFSWPGTKWPHEHGQSETEIIGACILLAPVNRQIRQGRDVAWTAGVTGLGLIWVEGGGEWHHQTINVLLGGKFFKLSAWKATSGLAHSGHPKFFFCF